MAWPCGVLVRALHTFTPRSTAELGLAKGDILIFIYTNPNGWAKGVKDGKRGWFPSSFVQPIQVTQQQKPKQPPKPPPRGSTDPNLLAARELRELKSTRHASLASPLSRNYPLESGEFSIVTEKQRISDLLDQWLPTRVNVHDETFNPDDKSLSTKRKILALIKQPRRPVFGVTLHELQRYGRDIPLVLMQCISFLSNADRYKTDGIFRVPGNKDRCNKLIAEFKDANEIIDLNARNPDAHTVASLLKHFFQQLPEAVIPPEYSQSIIKLYSTTDDKAELVRVYAPLLTRMPSACSAPFVCLVKFLHQVHLAHEENQMHARNLGLVWGITTLRPSEPAFMSATCAEILELLITEWPLLDMLLEQEARVD